MTVSPGKQFSAHPRYSAHGFVAGSLVACLSAPVVFGCDGQAPELEPQEESEGSADDDLSPGPAPEPYVICDGSAELPQPAYEEHDVIWGQSFPGRST